MPSFPPTRAWLLPASVLLGAFLMFFMEPMLSKALLPLFGGSYMV